MSFAQTLDRQIMILRRVESRDNTAAVVVTWQPLATIWAAKLPLRVRELTVSRQEERSEVRTVWRIRWRPDVTAAMRVVHGGDTFDIEGTTEVGRREALDLHCVEATP